MYSDCCVLAMQSNFISGARVRATPHFIHEKRGAQGTGVTHPRYQQRVPGPDSNLGSTSLKVHIFLLSLKPYQIKVTIIQLVW